MRERIKQWQTRFDARALRERAMIAVLTLIAIILFWQVVLMDPLEARRLGANRALQTARAEISAYEQQIAAVLERGRADPNAEQRQRLAQLEAESGELDRTLARKVAGLISPRQMAAVLEQVLLEQRDLKLRRVASLAPEPLTPAPVAGEEGPPGEVEATPHLYRHGVSIEFEGSFAASLRYLRALEAMQWGFYWGGFELTVERYPRSHMKLTVHTLSFDEGWIGV